MTTLALPSTPGAAGDAARRLATWLGTGIAAKDDSNAAALLVGLGAAVADTQARVDRALLEVIGATAEETLPEWEQSLGLLSGEGASVADRQAAVTARWRAINGGPSALEILRALRVVVDEVVLVEALVAVVEGTDPDAVFRLALLVNEAHQTDARTRAALAALLAPQAQAHVTWTVGRGAGPTIPRFRCAFRGTSADSRCDVDLLPR